MPKKENKTTTGSDPVTNTDAKLTEKQIDSEQLLLDLQRTRADFENYRKNSEIDKQRFGVVVKNNTLLKIIPIVDDIERASSHLPEDLQDNDWAKGVVALREKLIKDLHELGVDKINTEPGTVFDPAYHEAVQMEDKGGDTEVVQEELRSGWMVDGEVVRPAMVRVSR